MARPIDDCWICGIRGPLTFEHVPPRKAFNDSRIFEANVHELLEGKWMPGNGPVEGKYAQKGAGRYSLCEGCNNNTGSWYGPAYVEFAKRGAHLIDASQGQLSLAYPFDIFPLRVIKQIAVMFFTACGPGLGKAHPDLVRFVLNKEMHNFPSGLHLFGYYYHPTASTAIRQSGMTGRMDLSGSSHIFAEIAFPPFGFVLSPNVDPIHPGLCNLTVLGSYPYKLHRSVYLRMPVMPVVSWLPGDFRTEGEIAKTVAANERVGRYNLDVPFSK